MAAPTPWVDLVRLITDGWDVNASDTNIPVNELVQRTQHLKDLLDSLGAGESLFYRSVAMDSSVKVGQPVYLDADAGVFKPALAAIDYDIYGNYGPVSASSYVWGIVVTKDTSTLGDIMVAGILRDTDMADIIPDVTQSGAYYLSTLQAGKLSLQKPPVSVYVLYWWAESETALVIPTPREVLEDHIHYRFQLWAQPAGIANCPEYGDRHAVILPDADAEGWLPAAHPVFEGVAPAGAKFGYNLPKDIELSRIFPPIPIDSYYIEVFEGEEGTGRNPATFVKIDNNGIWWMTDCYGEAPWPIWYEPCSSSSLSSETCPPPNLDFLTGHGLSAYDYPMAIYLWFTKMVYKTDSSVVSKLVTPEGSPLKFFRCGTTEESSSGPLEAVLDLSFAIEDPPIDGALVIKTIDANTFQRGYVVEKIKSASANITVTATEDADGYGQGTIILDFNDPSSNNSELSILTVALDNVRQEEYQGSLFYGFLTGRESSVRCRIDVPATGFSAAATMKLRLRILGTAAGILPDLGFSYLRIPAAAATPVDLPTGDTVLADVALSGIGAVTANQYFEIDTADFAIAAGDTIFFTLSRTSLDTYGGTVGLLRQNGLTTPT